MMLTTKQCADALNALYDSPTTFDVDYIRREIEANRLKARINIKTGRRRARIRVHTDDMHDYVRQFHPTVTPCSTFNT